ncbi:MAG: elongation factor G [Bacteroidales bacterium]|nr:elongation factor G [Bacteroidales bacterium]
MKIYQTDKIKNLVLLGNSRSGKTSIAEAMLFNGGVIDRMGTVEAGNTVSDYNKIEQENESSIYSTVLYTEFMDNKINMIDAPGADDFVGKAYTAINPSNVALMLINAQNGVEVGTEIHARALELYEKPMVFVINQMDHDKANFDSALEGIKESFGSKVAQVQYPLNAGPEFNGIIDVITMKYYKYPANGGAPEVLEIPESEKGKAAELHQELIEKAAENDDKLMELFFENDGLSEDEMRSGITAGLIHRDLYPVFCTSAKKNIGVRRLMEFIVNVVPRPNECSKREDTDGNIVPIDATKPASIFVFKTSIEEHVGEVNYFKVITGVVNEGDDLVNQRTQNKERLTQLYVVAGKKKEKVTQLVAGDIGAVVKLKNTKTSDTLNATGHNVKYNPVLNPTPRHRAAIKPVTEGEEEKLGEALNRMHEIDPSIVIEYSKELRQVIVNGQGERHFKILEWHLKNDFKLETEYVKPRIPYRETITKVAQADYRHKKQSGGSGQFGEVHMVIEPFIEGSPDPTMYKVNGKEIKVSLKDKEEHKLPWGGKLIYINSIVGGSIDARFMPAILKGIMEKMEQGPLTGSYARDIRVVVYDGKMHPVDSNEISFKLAGRHAFSTAFKNAGPKILEPIYNVEVFVPADYMGDVMSDLQGRRAIVQGMSSEKGLEKIAAKVPLAEMYKYSTSLSSISQGRAMFHMDFAEYAPVPGEVQTELLKAYEEEQED